MNSGGRAPADVKIWVKMNPEMVSQGATSIFDVATP